MTHPDRRAREVDDLINRFLGRMPDAREANHTDPQYRWQITWLRRMLATMDLAMEDEGVPEHVRLRIIRTLVYGAPNEAEALARVEQMKAHAETLAKAPFPSIKLPWEAR